MKDRHVQWILGIIFSAIGTLGILLSFFMLTVYKKDMASGGFDLPIHIMFFLIALPFAIIGYVFLWGAFRKSAKSRRLRQYGIVKRGEIVEFERTDYYVNNRRLELVIVQTQDGEIYRSEGLLKNDYNYGDELDILVDPQDNRIYEVLL